MSHFSPSLTFFPIIDFSPEGSILLLHISLCKLTNFSNSNIRCLFTNVQFHALLGGGRVVGAQAREKARAARLTSGGKAGISGMSLCYKARPPPRGGLIKSLFILALEFVFFFF